jgi:hypothetical protein
MSSPAEPFDPYREWLGIQPHERAAGAADHYRLLGLARFEADAAKIAAVADARMAHVRRFQVGPRGLLTQQLLNELSAAKACLLSPTAKAAYDAELARALSAALQPRLVHPPVPPPGPPVVVPPLVVPPMLPAARDAAPEAAHNASSGSAGRALLVVAATALVALVAMLGWAIWRQRMSWAGAPRVESPPAAPVATEPELEPARERPIVQLQEGSGEVTLTAATAQLAGGVELQHSGTTPVLGPWTSRGAEARWRFRLIQPGFFQAEVKYAAAAEAGGEITLATGAITKTLALRSSGGHDQFLTETVIVALPAAGQHEITLYPDEPLGGDWLLVESVRLIPVGGAKPPAILPE